MVKKIINVYFENYMFKFYNKEIDENIDNTVGKKNYILSVINLFNENSKIYEMNKSSPILNIVRSNVKFLALILIMKEENIDELSFVIASRKWYELDKNLMRKNFLNEPSDEIKDFLIKTLMEKNLLDKFLKYLLVKNNKWLTQEFARFLESKVVVENILKNFIHLIENGTITNKKTIKLIYKYSMTND